jgi:hypothetical protein
MLQAGEPMLIEAIIPASAVRSNNEVHGPDRVGGCWALQGMPVTQWDFPASALLRLQTRLGIQSVHTLVVHDLARLAKLQIDHAGAVSAMALGQGDDLLLECGMRSAPAPAPYPYL